MNNGKYDYQYTLDNRLVSYGETSHAKILQRIRPYSKVLECGPAYGIMTRYLKESLHCSVYILELETESFQKAMQWADGGICANLETDSWLTEFEDASFDYIVYADVLEHLHDPLQVLTKMKRFLKPDGNVLLSVPNIANDDIIANLLCDRFTYTPIGLLDNTHIHFFARMDLHNMIHAAGYYLAEEDCIQCPPFSTEQGGFIADNDRENLNSTLKDHTTGSIYQFICRLSLTEEQTISQVDGLAGKLPNLPMCTFYWDYGEGYSEESKTYIQPWVDQEGKFSVSVSVVDNKNLRGIRFDPDGAPCRMRDITAASNLGPMDICQVNATFVGDGTDAFMHSDPIYYLKSGNIECISRIEINGYWKRITDLGIDNFWMSQIETRDAMLTEEKNRRLQAEGAQMDMQQRIHHGEQMQAQLIEQREQIQGRLVQLQEHHAQIQDAFVKTKEQFVQLTKEHTQIQNQFAQTRGRLIQLQEHHTQVRGQLTQTQEQLFGTQNQLAQLQEYHVQIQNQLAQTQERLVQVQGAYDALSNTFVVRCMDYLRKVICRIKSFLKKFALLRLLVRGLRCLKQNGWRFTWCVVKEKIYSKKTSQKLKGMQTARDVYSLTDGTIDTRPFPIKYCGRCPVAVHIHVYYTELLPDVVAHANNIPYGYDLFISTDTVEKKCVIEEYLKSHSSARRCQVKIFPNIGRDVMPLLIQMQDVIADYKYFCHIHTKKTGYFSFGEEWREYLYNNTLGSSRKVSKIISLFEKDCQLGLVFPEHFPDIRDKVTWGGDKELAEGLLQRMQLQYTLPDVCDFPAGNMFWARVEAVKCVFELNWELQDFPEEAAQDDCTIMHAIERIWPYAADANGYHYVKVQTVKGEN